MLSVNADEGAIAAIIPTSRHFASDVMTASQHTDILIANQYN